MGRAAEVQGSIPVGGKEFFSSRSVQTGLWTDAASYALGTEGIFWLA